MKKMLKILAMLLVIATVVFAAGCTSKEAEKKSIAEENVTEITAPAEVTPEEVTGVAPEDNFTAVNESNLTISENGTTVPIEEGQVVEEDGTTAEEAAPPEDGTTVEEDATPDEGATDTEK